MLWGIAMQHAARAFLAFLSLTVCLANGARAAPIHDAAKSGDVAALTALLDAGGDVNESNGIATPLYYSIKEGRLDAAKLLVARGADVNLAAKWGPPIMAAAGLASVEFIELLLDAGADARIVFKQQTPLHIVADKGCLECVVALVDKGADVNALNNIRQPPVHLAKAKGHQAVADYLLSHGYAKPELAPVGPLLATADATRGEKIFAQACRKCHLVEAKDATMRGPNLWNVVGRPFASVENFKYSAAMRETGGDWGYEALNVFISDPARAIPGMDMDYHGLPDNAERADLIAYLRMQSDHPLPLPH